MPFCLRPSGSETPRVFMSSVYHGFYFSEKEKITWKALDQVSEGQFWYSICLAEIYILVILILLIKLCKYAYLFEANAVTEDFVRKIDIVEDKTQQDSETHRKE